MVRYGQPGVRPKNLHCILGAKPMPPVPPPPKAAHSCQLSSAKQLLFLGLVSSRDSSCLKASKKADLECKNPFGPQ